MSWFYFCKYAKCISQITMVKILVFCIVFYILITSSGVHICTLKQQSMSTCRRNKHTQRHLVKTGNAILNHENCVYINVSYNLTMWLTHKSYKKNWRTIWSLFNYISGGTHYFDISTIHPLRQLSLTWKGSKPTLWQQFAIGDSDCLIKLVISKAIFSLYEAILRLVFVILWMSIPSD